MTVNDYINPPRKRFYVDAGIGIRGAIKREIRSFCWTCDIECDIKEDKGFLESRIYFTFSHPNEKVLDIAFNAIVKWVKANER